MATDPSPNMIEKALEWVVDVDVSALKASVEALRDKHPEDDEQAVYEVLAARRGATPSPAGELWTWDARRGEGMTLQGDARPDCAACGEDADEPLMR